jgi:hypothetical protein
MDSPYTLVLLTVYLDQPNILRYRKKTYGVLMSSAKHQKLDCFSVRTYEGSVAALNHTLSWNTTKATSLWHGAILITAILFVSLFCFVSRYSI